MTRKITFLFSLLTTAIMLTGCQAVGDAVKFIFAAGFWLGIILVVALILIIIFIIKKLF